MRHCTKGVRIPFLLQSLATALIMAFGMPALLAADSPLWVTYEGSSGPGRGKHIVLISGDDEYRSEEALPMLGKLLAHHHGFKCTVLFAVDPADGTIKPDHQTNIPGMEALDSADLAIVFLRFRHLADDQMKYFVDYVDSGRPIIGLRTATHAFNYESSQSPYAKYGFNSREWPGGFGQQVLGDTWIDHHGNHGSESTRGIVNTAHKDHPILRGVDDVWGPTDVYGIRNLKPSAQVLLLGQVIAGMSHDDPPVDGAKNNPMMPLAWAQEVPSASGRAARVFCTTMGASQDLESAGLRRLIVNAAFWGMKMEEQIKPDLKVDVVGPYKPTRFGFGTYTKGMKPADFQ